MKIYQGTRGADACAEVTVKTGHLPGETALFPAFARAEADETRARQTDERVRRVAEHRESMKVCWPEWSGPAAGGSGASGFCEVHTCGVHSLTHGGSRYHYMAPCRIESVSPDGQTIIVVVEYDRPGWAQDRYNGERLRLDITEVWPPVWLLAARRRRREAPVQVVAAPLAA